MLLGNLNGIHKNRKGYDMNGARHGNATGLLGALDHMFHADTDPIAWVAATLCPSPFIAHYLALKTKNPVQDNDTTVA